MMTGIFKRKDIVFWLMAIAVIVRIVGITKSFQGDELFSINDARAFAFIPEALLSDTHPPLYFYLLHFWMKISASESFLRVLSIIPGTALCYIAYLIARMVFDETTGIITLMLVSLAPIAVWSSQYVRTYSMATFFVVLSVYFMTGILKDVKNRRAHWLGYALSSAASIYTFYFSALVIIAENIYVVFFIKKKDFLNNWFISQAAIVMLYLPWIPYFFFQRSSYVGNPQIAGQLGFYIGNIHVGAILRSVAGLLGFDPRFLAKGAVAAHGLFMIGGAIAMMCFVLFVLAVLIKTKPLNINSFSAIEKGFLMLFIILAFVPFLIALILHQAFGIILMSHYFIASFVFLAICVSTLVVKYASLKIRIFILGAIVIIYCVRLAGMFMDREMDFISAHKYIKSVMDKDTLLVSPSFAGSCSYYYFNAPKKPLSFDGLFGYYFPDIKNKLCMEDPAMPRAIGRNIIAITYPTKLELKDIHKRFNALIASRNYALIDRKTFGDLIVERYRKK